MPKFINLEGQRFGKLVVRHVAPPPEHTNRSNNTGFHWLCDCDCGNWEVVRSKDLRSGNTKSCGCHKRQMAAMIWRREKASRG